MPHHPEPLPVVPNGDTYWNLVKPEARQWDCSSDLLLIHVKQLHAYDEESLESPILGFLKFCLFLDVVMDCIVSSPYSNSHAKSPVWLYLKTGLVKI